MKRRRKALIVATLVLGILAVCTGWMCYDTTMKYNIYFDDKEKKAYYCYVSERYFLICYVATVGCLVSLLLTFSRFGKT